VKTQRSNTTRSFVWDDEAPEEPLSQRAEQAAPQRVRALPGKVLEMDLPEEDELPLKAKPRFGGGSFDDSSKPRRRKASKAKRFSLMLAASVLLGGLVASASLLYNFLSNDAHFRITGTDNIAAAGLTEVSRAELLPVFSEDMGRNIFFVPLAERRRQLEEIPWVEKATVMRLLPNQIQVSIVERQPVAFVRQGAQIGLVDASGVLLTMPAAMMAQRHYSFPVVTGIDANDPPALRKARMAIYQHLLNELDANGQKLSEQISEIDLSDPADVRVLMPEQDGEVLAHFGQEHYLERYQHYKEHIAEWRQQYPKLAAVDLRYDQQVVLEMATNNAQTGKQSAKSTDVNSASSGQVAENVQVVGEKPNEHTPGAQALADSGSSDARDSAGAKAPAYQPTTYHSRSAGNSRPSVNVKPVKAKSKPAGKGAGKVKTSAAKKTNGKTRTAANAVKVNATAAKKANAKARNASAKAGKASTTVKAKKKKRAAGKRAALNVNKQKTASTPHPASSAEPGQ
jgi:cell division protein FtsQ